MTTADRRSTVPDFRLGATVWACWVVDGGQRYEWRSDCGRLAAWRAEGGFVFCVDRIEGQYTYHTLRDAMAAAMHARRAA